MPRGQKTPPELVYKIMTSWAATNNYSETARALNIPASTVTKIVELNKDKEEFVKLCEEKKADFAKKATVIIDKGMELLERRFDRALSHEGSLDVLIDEIFATDKEELAQDEKNKLVSKIRALQLQDIKAITTAIGTLFDKKILAEGKGSDSSEGGVIEIPAVVEEDG